MELRQRAGRVALAQKRCADIVVGIGELELPVRVGRVLCSQSRHALQSRSKLSQSTGKVLAQQHVAERLVGVCERRLPVRVGRRFLGKALRYGDTRAELLRRTSRIPNLP